MSYHPNIPQSNDDPSVSQGDLLDNFMKLNADFSVNHIPFTAGGNKGFHTMVQFPTVLNVDPGVIGLESAVFPKLGPDEPQLFFQNLNNTFQLTDLPIVNGTITNVIPGANGQVVSDLHGLSTGDSVTIRDVIGITDINGLTFVITVVDVNTFDLNALIGGAYVSGGTWSSPSSTRFGFFTPWGWIVNTGTLVAAVGPNTIQYSIPYPVGFTFYAGLLTPFTGLNNFSLQIPSLQTSVIMVSSAAVSFSYLIIGSGT